MNGYYFHTVFSQINVLGMDNFWVSIALLLLSVLPKSVCFGCNPFLTNGFVCPYNLDESVADFRCF